MLGASHIGFHLFEYARHFLTCCKRMLGADYTCEQGGQIQLLDNRRKVCVLVVCVCVCVCECVYV